MQLLSPRQDAIMALARIEGRVSVEALAEKFDVSPQTIRKDLNELCEARHLTRVHGGAMLTSGTENMAYAARRALAAAEKRRIAAAAATLVPDGSSLFINIGTTTEEVARALVNRDRLLVITNNLHVVSILLPSPGIEVVVAGGLVRRADGGIVGEATLDLVAQFKVDIAVIGASALDPDGTLLDFDYREVRVTQKIIENARKVVLVADALKFARTAPVRIAHVAQLAAVVTDVPPPERFTAACAEAGVQLLVAEESETAAA
jgi:DeoR family glycerol-3-phosphate regulon repressor